MSADPVGRLLTVLGPGDGPTRPTMGTVTALDPLVVDLDTGQSLTTPAAGLGVDTRRVFDANFELSQRVLALPFAGGHDYLVQPH